MSNSDWVEDDEIISFKAEFDKATKTTWRYNIIENKHKVSGLFYVKSCGRDDDEAPEFILLKAKVKR